MSRTGRGKPGKLTVAQVLAIRRQYDEILATPTVREAARREGISTGMFRAIGQRTAYKWVPAARDDHHPLMTARERYVKKNQLPLFNEEPV